ncbi:MAG: PIN domain-containing protein [Rhizobacter sp.]|nr:PIN domain-containing protein [Chlorobiales bacterium]
MSDNVFIDSNIALYLLDTDAEKSAKALNLIKQHPIISTQVVLEVVNICLKKFKFSKADAYLNARLLMNTCTVRLIDETTLTSAFDVSLRYQLSHWDSLIIAAALQNNCTVLYSEDLQHLQIIENHLTILNPFL